MFFAYTKRLYSEKFSLEAMLKTCFQDVPGSNLNLGTG
jgi:hypothetical protein